MRVIGDLRKSFAFMYTDHLETKKRVYIKVNKRMINLFYSNIIIAI